ncbi:MAG TPA: TetR family transcriptional regulator [Thermoanaerobaculia bacterium]|nr:TetR family transcriptional regulator [Thermoanaerobaculia bacterium]
MEHSDTRESLLDAAESLFSQHGIEAASLRQITQQAGANLAAVNYHFGSKDGLVRAVFSRRLKPLKDERIRLLEECDLEAEDALEQVLKAFLAPLLRMLGEQPERACGFGRLMGRAFSEPNEEVKAIVMEEFREGIERFLGAFRVLVPGLSEGERMWRFHFVAGAMAHTVSCTHVLEKYSGGACRPSDPEEALGQLVPFLAAGMRAPSPSSCT